MVTILISMHTTEHSSHRCKSGFIFKNFFFLGNRRQGDAVYLASVLRFLQVHGDSSSHYTHSQA